MLQTFLYLSRADIETVAIPPDAAHEAIDKAFQAHGNNLNQSLPKLSLNIAQGHAFQSMCAASSVTNVAALKWLGVVPLEKSLKLPSIQAIVCLNNYSTGELLAVMDGDLVTLLRTAAMSSVAAKYLAPAAPQTIGFVGCGAQAVAHLQAFSAQFGTLKNVITFSKTESSANALANKASQMGLSPVSQMPPEELVRECDIVITTVPNGTGMRPFLDPRWLKSTAFVSAVDLGRSWYPDFMTEFSIVATDSLTQGTHAYTAEGLQFKRAFDTDLVTLASSGERKGLTGIRTMFNFRGYALGDMALSELIYKEALKQGLGLTLPR